MTASILQGKHVATQIIAGMKQTIFERSQQGLRPPALAVIQVGDDPASSVYVNNKIKACADAGITSLSYRLETTISQSVLLTLIDELNQNSDVDGILVQLPLPSHINKSIIIEHIAPSKDVDGFHPYNLGRLAQGNPNLRPCTPYGIIQLLQYYDLSLSGLHAVVVGASNIVGRPMALELLLAGATVTICHRATRALENHVRMADLIVIATGSYDVVKTDWLHAKQIIVDVGMHRRENGSLHGDMDYSEAHRRVAWITPVPGGVGPMTICMLLQNTLYAADNQPS